MTDCKTMKRRLLSIYNFWSPLDSPSSSMVTLALTGFPFTSSLAPFFPCNTGLGCKHQTHYTNLQTTTKSHLQVSVKGTFKRLPCCSALINGWQRTSNNETLKLEVLACNDLKLVLNKLCCGVSNAVHTMQISTQPLKHRNHLHQHNHCNNTETIFFAKGTFKKNALVNG